MTGKKNLKTGSIGLTQQREEDLIKIHPDWLPQNCKASREDQKLGSLQATLNARQASYGDFQLVAVLHKNLSEQFTGVPIPYQLGSEPDMCLSISLILLKLARIRCGEPTHIDSWRDIAGYAQLIVNRLERESEQK